MAAPDDIPPGPPSKKRRTEIQHHYYLTTDVQLDSVFLDVVEEGDRKYLEMILQKGAQMQTHQYATGDHYDYDKNAKQPSYNVESFVKHHQPHNSVSDKGYYLITLSFPFKTYVPYYDLMQLHMTNPDYIPAEHICVFANETTQRLVINMRLYSYTVAPPKPNHTVMRVVRVEHRVEDADAQQPRGLLRIVPDAMLLDTPPTPASTRSWKRRSIPLLGWQIDTPL
jgi:hypothetical protein